MFIFIVVYCNCSKATVCELLLYKYVQKIVLMGGGVEMCHEVRVIEQW